MPDLAGFLDGFAAEIGSPEARRGYAVHRNTGLKGAIDALRVAFPTVERLVGRDWFSVCARRFVEAEPPRDPALIGYGAGFADFVARFEPARALPYLAEVARIDRYWTEAHIAADGEPLNPGSIPTDDLAALRPQLHPSVRFAWMTTRAPTIWSLNRPPADPPAAPIVLDDHGEGILVARPRSAVAARILDRCAFELLEAVSDGARLDEAIESAAEATGADPGPAIGSLFSAGVFVAPQIGKA